MAHLFEGKVCVVTGASTGIGLGLSRGLLRRGARVYMSSRTPAHIASAAESLREHGDRVHAQVLDVRDAGAVATYFDYVAARGPVDYAFCNAGVGHGQSFLSTRLEDWHTVLDVNLFGVVHCVQAVAPVMMRQGHGHIVNTSSVCGLVPLPYQTAYAASKYGVLGFGEVLRYELEPHGVRVSTVCPGAVDTNIFYRALDYSLHPGLPKPPEAISIDQAADEIIAGIEAGQHVIPIQDFARKMYRASRSHPEEVEQTMQALARVREKDPQYAGGLVPAG